MGVSRDFTTGRRPGATAVLEREPRPRSSVGYAPSPERRRFEPSAPRRAPERGRPGNSRVGSREVISVRGRRVRPDKSMGMLPKIVTVCTALLIFGIVLAMWLSGLSTRQTFAISNLTAQDSQLSNELETLNRDLKSLSSSAELARRAQDEGMVFPLEPGVLITESNGAVSESRPAKQDIAPIMDVNGAPVRAGGATSNPKDIEGLRDSLEPVPAGEQLPPVTSGVAPYAQSAPRAAAP